MTDQLRYYLENIAEDGIYVPQCDETNDNSVAVTEVEPIIEYKEKEIMQVQQSIDYISSYLYAAELDAVKANVVSLPQPNDPFTIKLPNADILSSPTLCVGEILSNERINLPYEKRVSNDDFYAEVVKSSCEALNIEEVSYGEFDNYDTFPFKVITSKLIELNSVEVIEGVEKIFDFFEHNISPEVNDIILENELKDILEYSSEVFTSARNADIHSALAFFQKASQGDIVSEIEEAIESQVYFNSLENQTLELDYSYYEPSCLRLLLSMFKQNLHMIANNSELQKINKRAEYEEQGEFFTEEFVKVLQQEDDYYLELIGELENENYIICQIIFFSLSYYCVKNHYIEELGNDNSFILQLHDHEYNKHCQQYFSQTEFSYALSTYKEVLSQDYEKIETAEYFLPLLGEEETIISTKGTVLVWNQQNHEYEPEMKTIQTDSFAPIPKNIKPLLEVEEFDEPKFISNNDIQLEVQEYRFEDYGRSYEDYAIRNLEKMCSAAKQRLVKRYRSNKNANSINAECIRCRKFFNDIDVLKRRIINENRSTTARRPHVPGVKRERRDKEAAKKINEQTQDIIKNKLDETEKYIEELVKLKPAVSESVTDEDDEVKGDNGLNIEIMSAPTAFKGILKKYQLIGVSWLYHMYMNGLSCLLCDEMGLGKTIECIAASQLICQREQRYGPFLVICPNSLLNNWVEEFKRFAPELNVWPYWGSVQQRQVIRSGWGHLLYVEEVINKYGDGVANFEDTERFGEKNCPLHVVITSYSLAVSDIKYLNKFPFVTVTLDEGQMIKSSETKRWRTLMNIECKQRIILSGTPIQNTLTELWSLLHFALPEVFKSRDNFTQWFTRDIELAASQKLGQIKLNQEELQRLEEILSPFVLRREKKDVAEQLGEKKEQTILCDLSRRQRQLYQGIVNRLNYEELFDKASDDELKNLVMELRKIVNHPQIFDRSAVKSPFMLLNTLGERIHVFEEDETEAETEAEKSAAESETASESVLVPAPVFKQPKIKFETQQLDDFADLMALQYCSDRPRETYLERSVRSDQNRLFEVEIPALVFGSFIDIENDQNFVVHSVAARTFNVMDVLRDSLEASHYDFLRIKTLVLLVKTICNNASVFLNLFIDTARIRHFPQSQLLMFIAEEYLQVYGKQSQDPPIAVSKHFPWECSIYAHNALGFTPLVYTGSVNYWQGRHVNMQDYCDLSGLLRPLQPNPQQIITPLMSYSVDELIEQSGKLNALDKLLFKLFEQKQVCLIYCQMTKMMDILEEYLTFRRYKYVRLDGSYSVTDRRTVVDKFMTDSTVFIFLLSTRAGSLGLNLTRANNVIFYEEDWNPQQDLEAEDRVHRLGQTKQVKIWKIIARNSIDEKIFERAEQKTVVQKLVLSGEDRDENGNLIEEINRKLSQKDVLLEILTK